MERQEAEGCRARKVCHRTGVDLETFCSKKRAQGSAFAKAGRRVDDRQRIVFEITQFLLYLVREV